MILKKKTRMEKILQRGIKLVSLGVTEKLRKVVEEGERLTSYNVGVPRVDIYEYEGRGYYIAVISEALKKTQEIEQWFEQEIGVEATPLVLGHIQRGGHPTAYDRLMAFHFVTHAIDGLLEGKTNAVVCYNDGGFNYKSIEDVTSGTHQISPELLHLGKEYEHL